MEDETRTNELPLNVEAEDEVERSQQLQVPFVLLNDYRSQLWRLNHHLNVWSSGMGENASNSQVLSAVTIMNMAEMILSQSTYNTKDDVSNLVKAFGCDFRHAEHLKRVLWLLDASRKFYNRQYDEAEELLMLVLSGFVDGHPIETVITFYGGYLRDRIDAERGRIDLERVVEQVDVDQAMIDLRAAVHECAQKLPYSQISHFTGIQTILDNVAEAEMIHFIDFGPKIGSYWIVVMDALARREGCPVKQLKISAVCSPKDNVERKGNLLAAFAESMSLPFVFKIVYSETWEFEVDGLEVEAGEAVAVYMEFYLIAASARSKSVEAVLKGIKTLNPRVIIVVDIEGSINGSSLTARFKEALLLSSAVFDGLEVSLRQEYHYRKIVEKLHFQEVICNGALSDDDDDSVGFKKCCKIDFWREYFSKFDIVEIDLSQPSMLQAGLMIRANPKWSSCMLKMNGKSMIVGWNGVPIQFVSAWKFRQQEASLS